MGLSGVGVLAEEGENGVGLSGRGNYSKVIY